LWYFFIIIFASQKKLFSNFQVELKINLNNLDQNGDRFRRKSTCLFNKQLNSNLWERRRATSIFEFCDNSTKINETPKIIKEESF